MGESGGQSTGGRKAVVVWGQGNRKFSTIRHIDDTHYYVDLVY